MGASIEWNCGIIRLGKNHFKKGDPYQATVSVLMHGGLAVLFGMNGKLSISNRKEIAEILKKYDVETVMFFRDINKGPKVIKI